MTQYGMPSRFLFASALTVLVVFGVIGVSFAEFTAAEKDEIKKLTYSLEFTFDAQGELAKAIAADGGNASARPVLRAAMKALYDAHWDGMAALALMFDAQPSPSQTGRDAFKAATRAQRITEAWKKLDAAFSHLQAAKAKLVDAEKLSTNSTYIGRVVFTRDQLITRALSRASSVNRTLVYENARIPNPPNIPEGPISTMVGPHGDFNDGAQAKWRAYSYTAQTQQNILALYGAEPLTSYATVGSAFVFSARIMKLFAFSLAKQGLIQFEATDPTEKFFAAMQRKQTIDVTIPNHYFQLSRVFADLLEQVHDKPIARKQLGEMIKNLADSWFRLDAQVNWLGYDQFPYCSQDRPAGCAGQQR